MLVKEHYNNFKHCKKVNAGAKGFLLFFSVKMKWTNFILLSIFQNKL